MSQNAQSNQCVCGSNTKKVTDEILRQFTTEFHEILKNNPNYKQKREVETQTDESSFQGVQSKSLKTPSLTK